MGSIPAVTQGVRIFFIADCKIPLRTKTLEVRKRLMSVRYAICAFIPAGADAAPADCPAVNPSARKRFVYGR